MTTPSNPPTKTKTGRKILLKTLVLIGVTLALGGLILVLTYLGIENKTLRENNQTLIEEVAKHEKELAKIHEVALDQGYKAAIWDVYFGTPNYLVQEENKEVSLWKKQTIDEDTKTRIKEIPQE